MKPTFAGQPFATPLLVCTLGLVVAVAGLSRTTVALQCSNPGSHFANTNRPFRIQDDI
jgi:hypothetical protein